MFMNDLKIGVYLNPDAGFHLICLHYVTAVWHRPVMIHGEGDGDATLWCLESCSLMMFLYVGRRFLIAVLTNGSTVGVTSSHSQTNT